MSFEAEQSIRDRVVEEHARVPHPHLDEAALKTHLIIHELVEKQLAEHDPREVGQALHRLLAGGLSRHEAIHAIGTIVAREALRMLSDKRPLDRAAYLTALERLSVESYRESLGQVPEDD